MSLPLGKLLTVAAMVIATASLAQPANAQQQGAEAPRAVIELFTSQGCSSCPAADVLFEQYTKRPDVLALSFSVHYWDKLGWKDTLASPKFTERQKAYARARGDGQVYTPQIVVNGHRHAIGSDKSAIDAGLKVAASPETWVPMTIVRSGAGARIEAPANDMVKDSAIIWLAAVTRKVEVEVKRGENAGRTLTYFNAVRGLSEVGVYQGKPLVLTLDTAAVEQSEVDALVALIQIGPAGPIVGASSLALK